MIDQPIPATARPSYSVVIAVRNGAKTLQRALDSVFAQTYHHIEIIVIDGASTDGTRAILERNTARIAYWESEPDRGIYHAWNKALDHISGEWICFLGADDRYHTADALERVASALTADGTRHRVAYGSVHVVREDGSVDRDAGLPWDGDLFRRGSMIPHQATFHHRTLFDRHGRFDERFRISGDYEFLLRELLDHDPLFIATFVVDMAAGGLSDRPSSKYSRMREIYMARYMHRLVATPPWRSWRLNRQLAELWIHRNVRPRVKRLRGVFRRRVLRRR